MYRRNHLHSNKTIISLDPSINPFPMNAFTASVTLDGLNIDYEVFFICKKFKAILKQKHLAKYVPYQLDFWKEKGTWKSYHPLTQQVINQFGTIIDDHLELEKEQNLGKSSAALG